MHLNPFKHILCGGRTRILYLCVLALLFLSLKSVSQNKNEDEIKKQANVYFEEEDYNNAYKLYSQLVSLYPKDPEYNYRLGVCMLFTEPDKKKPFLYFQIALRSPDDVSKDAKFYLAKTYHVNYKFDEAIKLYLEYKQTASASSVKKLQVDRELAACRNGKQLLSNLSDLVIISKKQLNEADYFRSYDIKDIGGKLLVKPDDFKSSYDKKKKDKSVVYLPRSGERVYYASYGENGAKGKDIYFVNRLPNGGWSKPQPMPSSINTDYDEDYPFLHPNGKTLYFSSKGHNSMGGYDVFKTTYDSETLTWSKPENLDFPINSPDDDILFVTDSLEKTAFFSTGRYSPYGKIDVLKISTERRPLNVAVLKGTVVKEDVGQSLLAKITVKNIENGEIVGTYQAKENGDYAMELPNGGKFIFTVETPGLTTQSDGVQMPIAYSLKPYKQVISYEKKVLKIINYFDGQIADDNYSMMIDLIEKKAKLEVNENDPSGNNLNNQVKNPTAGGGGNNNDGMNSVPTNNPTTQDNNTTAKTNTNQNVTNEQLLSIAKTDAVEAETNSKKLKQEAQDAFGLATQKTEEALSLQKEADEAIANANTITDITKKNEELAKANKLKEEATIATNVANIATEMAKKLEVDANSQQKEADLTNQYINQLEAITKNKNNKDALTKLEAIQKQLDELSKEKNQSDELFSSIKAEVELKQNELKKSENKSTEISSEINLIKGETNTLETDLANENDKSLKENISAQIRELKSDVDLKNKELAQNDQKITNLKNQLTGLNKELAIASKILNEDPGSVVIDNTNTNTPDPTNTIDSNTEGTANQNTTALSVDGLTSKYEAQLKSTEIDKTNKESVNLQNEILKNYNQELSDLIALDKNELSKTTNNAEKKELTKEIKELEKQKAANDKSITTNNTALKQLEGNAITVSTTTTETTGNTIDADPVNTTAAKTTTSSATAGNTDAGTNSTEIKTSGIENDPGMKPINTKGATDNTAYLNELNKLKNSVSLNSETAKNIFAYNNYKENGSLALKQAASQKFESAKSNEINLNKLIATTETTIKNSSENNADGLLNEADLLNNKAYELRTQSATKTGAEKEALMKQAVDNENAAVEKKLKASEILQKQNKNTFDTNLSNLTELQKLTGSKTTNEISQASMLADEAVINFSQAQKIRDESNAYPSGSAKLGGLSNAEEKENEALLKQKKAVELLAKANPSYSVKTSGTENDPANAIVVLNNEVNKTAQSQVDAYGALSKANQNELKLLNDALLKNAEFKAGENPEAQNLKKEADGLNAEATALLSQSASVTDPSEKANLLLKANDKEIAVIKKLNEATTLLKTTPAIASTVTENNTTENKTTENNTTSNSTQTENQAKTGIAKQGSENQGTTNSVETNTSSGTASITTVPVNDNNANNSTSRTTTVTPSGTNNNSGTDASDISKLKAGLNNAGESNLTAFNTYSNNEAIALKEKATEKINAALEEDKVISASLDNVSQLLSSGTSQSLSQEAVNNAALEADKMNEEAYELRRSAASKTGDEKEQALNQAKQLEEKAISTKVETAKQQQQLNSATFEANAKSLEELAAMAKGKNIAELGTADMQTDEATQFFNQAQKLREETNAYPTDAAKLGGLSNAEEKEAIALSKQKNLLATYKKYFSNYTPATPNTTVNNPAATAKLSEVKSNLNTNNQAHIDGLLLLSQAVEKEYKSRLASLPAGLKGNQLISKTKAQELYNKYQASLNQASQTTDAAKKKALLIDANKNGQEAISLLSRISVANTAVVTNNQDTTPANTTANSNRTGQDNANTKPGNQTNANTSPNNQSTNRSKQNTSNTSSTPAVKLKVEGLEVKKTNAYTANNPIPLDEKIQDGLVFKVQIGAFKSPLPNNTFKGLSPVIAQTTPSGYIRYMAGNFEKYESANAVKNDLKNLGYSDAFVVVYFNGKRINLNEGVAKAKEAGQEVDPVANTNTSAGINTDSNIPRNTFTTTPSNTTPATNDQPVEIANELEKMNGLLYTVQIGVYSKQVTRSQLNNLRPIYTEKLPSGLYRYTAGIYNQSAKLLEDKRKVVELGVKDAFVSAYYNAKRIPFTEGQKLQAENNNLKMETQNPIIFSGTMSTATPANAGTTTPNITAPATASATPSVAPVSNASAFNNGVTSGPAPTADNGVKTDEAGISYKVQIGAYKNQVPNDVAARFMNIKTWPVNNLVINGLFIYTIGNFNGMAFAKKLKEEAVSLGISDAFITVYKDGKKLYGAEALQYLNK